MFLKIRRWFRRTVTKKRFPAPAGAYSKVELFFTNAERLIALFRDPIERPALSKRLFVLHGIGGVGKSTLLMMFQAFCGNAHIASAKVSGEDAVTEIGLLSSLASHLASHDTDFPRFRRSLHEYLSIQAKVDAEASKLSEAGTELAKDAAELAAGAVPVVGAILGKVSRVSIDWLRAFLKKPQIEMWRQPATILTADFLSDLTEAANTRRVVVMIDTYERIMEAVDDWLCRFVQQLPHNVLMVIAGRDFPMDRWTRSWPGWMTESRVEEVRTMEPSDMKKLLLKYFSVVDAAPPSRSQVEEIVDFARGLPLVITTVAHVWRKWGFSDFRTSRPQVVADLVDRLMERVPDSMRPLLIAAATLRWFNKELLTLLIGSGINDQDYDEVRRFEFMGTRAEGQAMHDVVREIIDDNLRTQDPQRHRQFHATARDHFQSRVATGAAEEQRRAIIEYLYHAFRSDEQDGVRVLRATCEQFLAGSQQSLLRAVIAEAKSWPLAGKVDTLWRDYYIARVQGQFEGKVDQAEHTYNVLSTDRDAHDLLRAYALCDLGHVITRWERIGLAGGVEKALDVVKRALEIAPLDSHLVDALFYLARIAEYQGKWDEAASYIQRSQPLFEEKNDYLGQVRVFDALHAAYVLQGNWRGMRDAENQSLELLRCVPGSSYLKARASGYWAWAWVFAGRYAETERKLRDAIPVVRDADESALPTYLRHLGLVAGMQGRFADAERHLKESIDIAADRGPVIRENWATSMAMLGLILTRRQDFARAVECLEESLAAKVDLQDRLGIPEALVWQGELYAAMGKPEQSLRCFEKSLEWVHIGRKYCETGALAGIAQVQHQYGSLTLESSELRRAEIIAAEYEYNDYLAAMRLLQGRLALQAFDGDEAALKLQQSAIYALRFNRFLLDEVRGGPNHRDSRISGISALL